MSAWIEMIADNETDGELAKAFEMARTPHGTVDNVMRVHSLRPKTMIGHVLLYRAVLHDERNTLPTWLQETLGSYVSLLNECDYSFANHWANAKHLIGDKNRSAVIESAMRDRRPQDAFDGLELALMRYAQKLTLSPNRMEQSDIELLRSAGVDDGQILEANQIVGYFSYANRLLNGLGVTLDGDIVGFYPSGDEN